MSGQPPDLNEAPPPPLPEDIDGPPAQRAVAPPSAGSEWLALLRNRLILGGLGLLVVLLLITVVLVLVGGGNDEPAPSTQARTPEQQATVVIPAGGLPGRMKINASVRSGPGPTYQFLGTVARTLVIAIVGRSEDSAWLQVIYPLGSELRGWVDATLIDVTGDVATLTIASPNAGPVVDVPTSGPIFIPTEVFTPEVEPTETAALEPTDTPRHEATNTPRPTRTRPPTPSSQTPTPPPQPTATPAQ